MKRSHQKLFLSTTEDRTETWLSFCAMERRKFPPTFQYSWNSDRHSVDDMQPKEKHRTLHGVIVFCRMEEVSNSCLTSVGNLDFQIIDLFSVCFWPMLSQYAVD